MSWSMDTDESRDVSDADLKYNRVRSISLVIDVLI